MFPAPRGRLRKRPDVVVAPRAADNLRGRERAGPRQVGRRRPVARHARRPDADQRGAAEEADRRRVVRAERLAERRLVEEHVDGRRREERPRVPRAGRRAGVFRLGRRAVAACVHHVGFAASARLERVRQDAARDDGALRVARLPAHAEALRPEFAAPPVAGRQPHRHAQRPDRVVGERRGHRKDPGIGRPGRHGERQERIRLVVGALRQNGRLRLRPRHERGLHAHRADARRTGLRVLCVLCVSFTGTGLPACQHEIAGARRAGVDAGVAVAVGVADEVAPPRVGGRFERRGERRVRRGFPRAPRLRVQRRRGGEGRRRNDERRRRCAAMTNDGMAHGASSFLCGWAWRGLTVADSGRFRGSNCHRIVKNSGRGGVYGGIFYHVSGGKSVGKVWEIRAGRTTDAARGEAARRHPREA